MVLGQRRPGCDDRCQVQIYVHAPCKLVVHTYVLSVSLWCMSGEGSWDAREGRMCTDLCASVHACEGMMREREPQRLEDSMP